MRISLSLLVASVGLALSGPSLAAATVPASEVKLLPLADRIRIEIGGRLFSEYVFSGGQRSYLYPILAADGTGLTRDWPQQDTTPGEEKDHPHHHSLWFGHGAVNGNDFWREIPGTGRIVTDGVPQIKSGATGTITTRDRWLDKDGKLVCTDEVTIRIQVVPTGRMLDYDITLHALPDTPLVFGDSKEGTMALRVAQWMTPPHVPDQKRESVPGVGHIVLADGLRDNATWGKPAEWCDFYAPHGDKVLGVAIFDHPANPHHPTPWMVRPYGLFAANPFGLHDFDRTGKVPAGAGDLKIPAGGAVTFRYRFYFHEGDTDAAKVAENYRSYAAGK